MTQYTMRKAGKTTRRFKTNLQLTSEISDLNKKFRAGLPGKSPKARVSMGSTYKQQKEAKQMVRFFYDVSERHMRRQFKDATRLKGDTGEIMLQLLEQRLDNVVYRAGFAVTRRAARQLVNHKKIMVNGQVVNVSSYMVKPGDKVEVREAAQKQQSILNAVELAKQREPIDWVTGVGSLAVVFENLPARDKLPTEFMMNMIIELYKR